MHIFSFFQTVSNNFLLEGDILIPKTRTAMKCMNKAYSCLWQKSANGNVEIPYLISEKYGMFYYLRTLHIGVSFTQWIRDVTDKVLSCTTADNTERSEILRAMKDFEYKTCIRFVPRAAERAYLSIQPRYGWVNDYSKPACEGEKYRTSSVNKINVTKIFHVLRESDQKKYLSTLI